MERKKIVLNQNSVQKSKSTHIHMADMTIDKSYLCYTYNSKLILMLSPCLIMYVIYSLPLIV